MFKIPVVILIAVIFVVVVVEGRSVPISTKTISCIEAERTRYSIAKGEYWAFRQVKGPDNIKLLSCTGTVVKLYVI